MDSNAIIIQNRLESIQKGSSESHADMAPSDYRIRIDVAILPDKRFEADHSSFIISVSNKADIGH